MAKGLLITCEGIDGSGKSTAARALVDALRSKGRDARLHAEPTKTWLGEAVRRGFTEDVAPYTEALLFMADHATHVRDVEPELAKGAIVVSDRWSDSTFAYQGAALAKDGFDAVLWLQDTELAFDRKPDVTLLFDLDVDTAMARVSARGTAEEKFEKHAFLDEVRANYLRLADEEPDRFVVIDASRAPEKVFADALRAVETRLA